MKLRYTLLLSALISANIYAGNSAHVQAHVKIGPNTGRINHSILFQSGHDIFISNPYNDRNMTYTYVYKLCSDRTGCKIESYTKTLTPGQIYTENHILQVSGVWPRAGSKSIWAITQVIGEFNEFDQRGNSISVWY